MLMGKEGGFLHGKMKVFSVNGIDIIWYYGILLVLYRYWYSTKG